MKEKSQPSAAAVAPEPAPDVQYSVTTGNKFDGVAEASDDPIEMLEKLSIEAKAPKDKKTDKSAQKDKKKPASAPQKPAKGENATANEKPTKKDEKPANVNTQKAQDGKPEGVARAPRGRGGRVGGLVAGFAGVADEHQPPASAPVQREPPPPPKYDQPRPEGAGAPRGRGGRGFGFGGGRGRGYQRGVGPRLAFADGAPTDTNAASGAAPGGQEGGATGGDDFVNRGFDAARHSSGGYRGGGRGGFRGGRGLRGRGFGRPVDFGAPEVPGGPPVARKREFDRHSGSDVTGVRQVDKREGAGAHNWGTVQDDLAGQTALNESEIVEEGAPTTAPATGEQVAPAEGAEAPKEGEGDKSAEDAAKAEDEKKELTLDEYKAQLQQKLIPKTNFNVRSPEGADLKGLKQVVKKKEDQTEYVEEENAGEADADANKKGAKVAKQPKAAPVKDVGFRYENPQADFGPRGRRGGRGFRGGGGEGGGFREGGGYREGGFREGGGGFREGGGGFRGRERGRFRGEGGVAPPRLEDEDAFPALNPLGPH